MIEPNTTDLGRRVKHSGFFGHERCGVLKGYDSKGYARVLFDGRHEYSYVTLKNVTWDDVPDARCLTAPDGACISEAACMHSPAPAPDTSDEDDDDDLAEAAGEVLGGILGAVLGSGDDNEDDDDFKGDGGSYGGGGASGDF